MSITEQIETAGRKLAAVSPDSSELRAAREWWTNGRWNRYDNEDTDVLQGLTSAIYRARCGR